MKTLICKICGKEFGVSNNRVGKAIYCSMQCYGKSKIGKKWEIEVREKLSNTLKGHPCYFVATGENSPHWKGGEVILTCKTCGKKFLVRQYRKNEAKYCSRKCKCDDNLGLSPPNERQRKTKEYKLWRRAIFERDDYTCQECGKRGGCLLAHHVKPFSVFPELRLEISNGVTLCKDCHKTKHKGIKKLVKDYLLAKVDNF
jgi:ribosomal protein L32